MPKSLLIVGAGPGLGLALANRFGSAGYRVGLIARDPEVLDSMTAALAGIEVHTELADVTQADQLQLAIDNCAAAQGPADVVISNTSMYVEATPTQVPLEVFEKTWQVACRSTLITLQAVAPGMRSRGSGVFLIPGTPVAIKPWPGAAALGAAKAAARNLVMGAHQELLPDQVFAAVVTIDGMIKAGTGFDPELIAERFYEVAALPAQQWAPEFWYQPA